MDVDSRDILTWKEAGMFVSEPIFVPRPHCKSEDDGILCVTLLGNNSFGHKNLILKIHQFENKLHILCHIKNVLMNFKQNQF